MNTSMRAALALPLCLSGWACTTVVPDVSNFAEATVDLRAAVSTAGDAAIDELERRNVRSRRIGQLREAWELRNKIMTAMAVYTDSLSMIVSSGERNAEAAEAVVDAVVKFASQVGYPIAPAAAAASDSVKAIAVEIAKARALSDLNSALEAVQPSIERLIEILENDLRSLDRMLLGASREAEEALHRQKRFRGLDELRGRLLGFMQTVDPEVSAPEELSKAADAAAMLQATQPLVSERDRELAEIESRVGAVRQLLTDTRVCARFWAMSHQNLTIAVRHGTRVDVASIIEAAGQIRRMVQRLREL